MEGGPDTFWVFGGEFKREFWPRHVLQVAGNSTFRRGCLLIFHNLLIWSEAVPDSVAITKFKKKMKNQYVLEHMLIGQASEVYMSTQKNLSVCFLKNGSLLFRVFFLDVLRPPWK